MEKAKLNKEGLVLIDKPRGMTSHDVVDCLRRKFCMKRIGHAGTLDPDATGLLIMLVGKYTKMFSRFVDFDKEYTGVMKLGEKTSTGDAEGKVIETSSWAQLSENMVREAVLSFRGEIEQVPPMVSAVRINGKRLYKLARKGIEVERPPRKIRIYELEIMNIELPLVEFYVKCSKGTYIRKLAEDIGDKLGCGAHMIEIKRTAIGPFSLENAVSIDEVKEAHLQKHIF